MIKLIGICLIVLCWVNDGLANHSISGNAGLMTVSYAENQSQYKVTDGKTLTATSGSMSSMSFFLGYEYIAARKFSFIAKAVTPLVTTTGGGFFGGSLGVNYYFSQLNSNLKVEDAGRSLSVVPKFKYYIGLNAGLGFMIYVTESAKKSDLLFTVGFQAGAQYSYRKNVAFNTEVVVTKGTGVATTTMNTAVSGGITYNFN